MHNLYHTTSLQERNTDNLSELDPRLSFLYTARIMRQYSRQIQSYERILRNMNHCFLSQSGVYASQVKEAIEKISKLRNAILNTRVFLMEIQPELTQKLLPFVCIDKLSELDYKAAELLAYLATFRSIFSGALRADIEEIIALYLSIRKHSPQLVGAFDVCVEQLAQFVKRASVAATEKEGNYYA